MGKCKAKAIQADLGTFRHNRAWHIVQGYLFRHIRGPVWAWYIWGGCICGALACSGSSGSGPDTFGAFCFCMFWGGCWGLWLFSRVMVIFAVWGCRVLVGIFGWVALFAAGGGFGLRWRPSGGVMGGDYLSWALSGGS